MYEGMLVVLLEINCVTSLEVLNARCMGDLAEGVPGGGGEGGRDGVFR